ncbi:PIN domain-containing protein [Chryseobacterium sp. GP-SGM7]|uniref:PIN domain-containing protein n=1 Tax=Chryseobacterium sp. GP-SGM7 TaxID=3411323 RepID=UPI003B939431
MSGKNILADSNVLINFLNGEHKNLKIFSDNIIFISVITKIELLSAPLNEEELLKIKNFLENNFNLIFIDETIAEKSAYLRRQFKLKTPDAIISATAIENKFEFLTEDIELVKKLGKEINFI